MAIKNIFKLKRKDDKTVNAPATPARETDSVSTAQSSLPSKSATTSYTSLDSPVNSSIYAHYLTLNNNPEISKELVPIVTLLDCQASRVYHQGDVFINVEHNDIPIEKQDLSFAPVKAIIKGNLLIAYKDNSDFRPVSIDLLEATFKLQSEEKSFIITSSDKLAYHIRFIETASLQQWVAAIKLSNYEYIRLNEAYTASLLSAKGSTLSDLHVVLAETRYNVEEWCSIKFGKKGKWINCYSVVTPFEKSRKGYKNGSISFYTSSKTSKKNLILTVSNIENCYAVFPHVDLIEESSLLKVHGDATVYNLGSNNCDVPNRSRSASLVSSTVQGHSRSNSVKSHSRAASISSSSSSKSLKGLNIPDTSLYILPKPHNGVKSFETLIRYLIPVYDSFQLYGRPKKLNANKTDPESLLFGLPSLPHVEVLSSSLANELVAEQWESIVQLEGFNEEEDQFNYTQLFNFKIKQLYDSDGKHAGFGDLKTIIYQDSEYISPLVKFNNMDLSDNSSEASSPKCAFSISDLPANAPPDQFSSPDLSNNNFPQFTPQSPPVQGWGTTSGRFRSDSLNSNTQQRLSSSYRSNGNLNATLTHSRGGSLLGGSLRDEQNVAIPLGQRC